MRLTLRDEKILAELSLNTYSLNQIASTFFTSRKKASERMKKLYDAGLVKRIPHPFASSTGKAEFVYSTKPIKDVYAVPHSLMITDVKLSFLLSFPPCFKSEFYYPKQLNLKAVDLCGVIPDGISIIENVESGKRIVHFVEADCGTEMLKSKRGVYSLEHKLEKYIMLFDDEEALRRVGDVLGCELRGFRVLLVGRGEKRLDGVKRVSEKLGAEFVWCALHEDIKKEGVYSSVWSNYRYAELSLLRPYPGSVEGGDLDGEKEGDLVGDVIPVLNT